jgi:MFS family permease
VDRGLAAGGHGDQLPTANSALHLRFCRFLLGLGEAGNWPGGVKAISEWFPARERAFAMGLFNSGSCLGAVVDRFSSVPVFTAAAVMPLAAATIILLTIRGGIDQNG